MELARGVGGLLEDEEAVAGNQVIGQQQVAPMASPGVVGDEILLRDQVVLPVGLVHESHRLHRPVLGLEGQVVQVR